MAQPAILAVDDDHLVLEALRRDLEAEFGGDYRIIPAAGGEDALAVALHLQERGETIALFVVDQRMPEMTGVAFLDHARRLFPDAKKVLLTAYADIEVAITAINDIGLDLYLVKPWDPPEETLYPALSDLLAEWTATAEAPWDGIRVAGALWSARSHDVKDFLARNRIPYRWLDTDADPEAGALVARTAGATPRLPVVFFPDGEPLVAPSHRELADRIGLRTRASAGLYDLVIVGGGPAGLAAAVNGAAEGIRTVLIETEATGGQAGTSSLIVNYLGFPHGISGGELARRATMQAERLGAEILLTREAVGLRKDDPYRYVKLADGSEIGAKAVLIATGVSVRELHVPGVRELTGAGVYYGAALTEARNYAGKAVAIVGGANSAGQAAMLFARSAQVVYLVVRAATLEQRMSSYLVDEIRETANIDVRLRAEIVEVAGDKVLERMRIAHKDSGDEESVDVAAMAIFVGARPRTEFLDGVVARTGAGFIPTGRDLLRRGIRPEEWVLRRDPFLLETSVPGVFAAGDVRHGAQARVGAAVGTGGMAVGMIREYLKTV